MEAKKFLVKVSYQVVEPEPEVIQEQEGQAKAGITYLQEIKVSLEEMDMVNIPVGCTKELILAYILVQHTPQDTQVLALPVIQLHILVVIKVQVFQVSMVRTLEPFIQEVNKDLMVIDQVLGILALIKVPAALVNRMYIPVLHIQEDIKALAHPVIRPAILGHPTLENIQVPAHQIKQVFIRVQVVLVIMVLIKA